MKKSYIISLICLIMAWMPNPSIGQTPAGAEINPSGVLPEPAENVFTLPNIETIDNVTAPVPRELRAAGELGNSVRAAAKTRRVGGRVAAASLSLSGDGTQDSPYLVGSASDWNALAEYIATNADALTGKYVSLSADIDFTDDTIIALAYDGVTAFDGTLNGGGYTIKGFSVEADAEDFGAVIMTTGSNAYISNLTVEGSVTTAYSYTGGIVGGLYGTLADVTGNVSVSGSAEYCMAGLVGYAGSTAVVSGCTNTCAESISGAYSGGVVGYAYACTVTGCSNSAAMTFSGNFSGGVVGYANAGTVSDCTNSGAVTSKADKCAAGVVGASAGATVSGCTNTGTISSSGIYSGGVAAYCITGTVVSDCSNTAAMTVDNYGGGVAGYAYDGVTVKGCSNSGNIITYTGYGVGGIVCSISDGAIENCTNSATVKTSSGYYVGGIAAYVSDSTSVTACTNKGTVSGIQIVGGITGLNRNSQLYDCTNSGTIDVSTLGESGSSKWYYYIGGVAGYLSYTSSMSGCTNEGAISTASYNSKSYTYYYYIGGVAGYIYSDCELTQCTNSGALTALHDGYGFGGIAGFASDASFSECVNNGSMSSFVYHCGGVVGYCTVCSFESCGNNGDITNSRTSSSTFTGGFAGNAYVNNTFTDCYNTGSVTNSYASAGSISGFIAYFGSSNDSGYGYSTVLTGCYNTGDVTGYSVVSGLLGSNVNNGFDNVVTLQDCYNAGNITATNTATDDDGSYPTAGLSLYYYRSGTITGCWNSGDVTSYGYGSVGGLFGCNVYSVYASSSAASISNCYNTGNIYSGGRYAGGIIGYMYVNTAVDSCWNTGDVECGTYGAGGIAGNIYGYATSQITNCWNAGSVTAGTAYAGGIAGRSETTETISGCFNTGSVSSLSDSETADETGGFAIGGILGYGGATMTNVYNAGDVSGALNAGGLIGFPVAGTTSVDTAYSAGSVTAPEGNAGNIVGVDTDNETYWTSSDNISNTYYLSETAVECNDDMSTAVSRASLATLDLGTNWTAGDDYTYPRLTSFADIDYAKAYAAAVIPTDSDSYDSITQDFCVGTPDGITWTASSEAVTIDGNTAAFGESFSGTLTMTATSGDVSVETTLVCEVEVETTGISNIEDLTEGVVNEKIYTVDGKALNTVPSGQGKAVYIVKRTYSNGTTVTAKETR